MLVYDCSSLDSWFAKTKSVMLVCGKSLEKHNLNNYFKDIPSRTGVKIVRFSDFKPNPVYEAVLEGVKIFKRENCDSIVAVGGGSTIDVAKCIKIFATMDGNGKNGDFLQQKIIQNSIHFLAIPTTAGTGSEATKYAVIYYNGEKQNITHESCMPDTVLFDANLLKTLPDYQRKATMCDAFSHALESFWSVNSTAQSKILSKEALERILEYKNSYLQNTYEGNLGMLKAANTAGKAINITQTTAGHAMSYKITSLFNIAHGHAVILCNRALFSWMIEKKYLNETLNELAKVLGCIDAVTAANKIDDIFRELHLEIPIATPQQFSELKNGVNPVRLKNHPIKLTDEYIDELYHKILRSKQ